MDDSEESRTVPLERTGDSRAEPDMEDVLLRKRESILAQLKEIDAGISQLRGEYYRKLKEFQLQRQPAEEKLHHVEALLQMEGHASTIGREADQSQPQSTVRTGTAFALDAAYRLLERTHRPMRYRDIAEKLQEQHIYIPGKDAAATLLSGMTRDTRFKRTTKRGVYALAASRVRAAKPKKGSRAKTPKRR